MHTDDGEDLQDLYADKMTIVDWAIVVIVGLFALGSILT